MADPQHLRKSGKTTSEEMTKEVAKEFDRPLVDPDIEGDSPRFKRPYFQRLRTDWDSEQKIILQRVHGKVEKEIRVLFSEAFDIMYELYAVVRTSNDDEEAEDPWLKNEYGSYVEDWGKLNHKQRERFLFLITTRLFTWEQQAASLNFDALFAKAEWEQSFATGFESLPPISSTRPTVDDRTHRGRLHSQDDYYFALIRTYFSRRADAVVRSMSAISQRIKDVHMA